MSRVASLLAVSASLLLTFAAPQLAHAEAVDDEYDAKNFGPLVSSVPLFGFDHPNLWPRHFDDEDPNTIGGCESRVRFGYWRETGVEDGEEDITYWRFRNYGVLHCAAVIEQSWEQERLDDAEHKYGFFVLLDSSEYEGQNYELWAIQALTGFGAQYYLLARKQSDQAAEQFLVLGQKCTNGQWRQPPSLDLWASGFCEIDTSEKLGALAKEMLSEGAIGELVFSPDEEVSRKTED